MELLENKEPRFKNRGLFATPATQAALPWPSYFFALLRSILKLTRFDIKENNLQRRECRPSCITGSTNLANLCQYSNYSPLFLTRSLFIS